MRTRLGRVIDALFGPSEARVGPESIVFPDGREYVRIERAGPIRTSAMPAKNEYVSDEHQAARREAAMSLMDPETHGFFLVVLKPETPPARVTAQIHPAWRGYLGGILGGVLRQYARGRPGAHSHSRST